MSEYVNIGMTAVRPAAPLTMPIVGGLTMASGNVAQIRLGFEGETKICTACKRDLPLERFQLRSEKGRLGEDLYRSHCTTCRRLTEHYKINYLDYQAMLESQGNACAICKTDAEDAKAGYSASTFNGSSERTLYVDHDHETGEVRGLLCMPCNSALGFLKESPDVVRAALSYLEGKSDV